jgi:hypothetical protein
MMFDGCAAARQMDVPSGGSFVGVRIFTYGGGCMWMIGVYVGVGGVRIMGMGMHPDTLWRTPE